MDGCEGDGVWSERCEVTAAVVNGRTQLVSLSVPLFLDQLVAFSFLCCSLIIYGCLETKRLKQSAATQNLVTAPALLLDGKSLLVSLLLLVSGRREEELGDLVSNLYSLII